MTSSSTASSSFDSAAAAGYRTFPYNAALAFPTTPPWRVSHVSQHQGRRTWISAGRAGLGVGLRP